jgi:hypothetical protein
VTATLRFDVVSNGSVARRDLAATRSEVERFGRSTDTVAASSERNRSKVSRFGSAIAGAARTFGPLAAAAAAGAVLKFGADAVRTASETEQAMGAVDAVFGRNSAKVKAWANSAVRDVGLARGEYAGMAATLGAALRNSGVEGYTVKTRRLIKVGADLAAQFGGSTQEAVSALGSLMRGETDPIERYGVSIKQSDVNARLAAKGQDKLTGAARKSAEMQARLDLMFKQTKVSTGAFARESSTLSGQQQRLKANFANVKDTLGRALLPALTGTLRGVNSLFGGGKQLGGGMRTLGGIVRAYATPVMQALRSAMNTVKSAFSSAGGSGEGFKRLASALAPVARTLASILGQSVAAAIRTVSGVFGAAAAGADRLAGAIASVVNWAREAWNAISNLANSAGINKILGLLRAGDSGSVAGLQRAAELSRASAGSLGIPHGMVAPRVTLTSAPSVVVQVDSPALARLFRVIVRDELVRVGYGGRVALT